MNPPLRTFAMKFDGAVLARGFWIYTWKVRLGEQTFVYVGRTGDSSSPHASSPFSRIGRHLDFRGSAKGNSLARHLRSKGIDAKECQFEMVAIGPLFAEVESMEKHIPLRNQVSAIERRVADLVATNGYRLLGVHDKAAGAEPLSDEVARIVAEHFPPISAAGEV